MNAWLRLSAWLLALVLVVLPVIAVLNGWIAAERWPIARLQVVGTFDHVSAESVRAAVRPVVGSGFFAIDLGRAHAAVAGLPWVRYVQVRKRWPDVLEVTVYEHVAVARWGDERWLSRQGWVFAAPDEPALASLPQLAGPDSRRGDVIALYRNAQTLFAAQGRSVRELRLSARGSWSLRLDDDTRVMIGRDDPEQRMARFVRVLPQLLANPDQRLARVDLRYTNGFAVTWAAPAAPAAQPANHAQAPT
jgi:cell division protein FtsQ